MACRTVDLQDLAYGFLDPDAEARVRDHVAGCARCRAELRAPRGEKRIARRRGREPRLPRERRAARSARVRRRAAPRASSGS
jgi:anti-sigma factor RsiW